MNGRIHAVTTVSTRSWLVCVVSTNGRHSAHSCGARARLNLTTRLVLCTRDRRTSGSSTSFITVNAFLLRARPPLVPPAPSRARLRRRRRKNNISLSASLRRSSRTFDYRAFLVCFFSRILFLCLC